jgi:hypothetical protein
MARTAGAFYFLEGATSAYGAIHVVSQVTVPGDAAATAARVLGNQPLLWAGFGLALVAVACHIVYAVLFYELFKPVSRPLSLLAVAVSLVAAAIQGGAALFQAAPLLVLRSGGYASGLGVRQQDALALFSLSLSTQAFDIYLVFFGLWLALTGYLIVRSTFIPSVLGVLAVCGGLCYLILLVPPLASYLSPWYLAPDVIAEPALMLWLLIVGLNPQRWLQQAGRARVAALPWCEDRAELGARGHAELREQLVQVGFRPLDSANPESGSPWAVSGRSLLRFAALLAEQGTELLDLLAELADLLRQRGLVRMFGGPLLMAGCSLVEQFVHPIA